MGGYTHLVFDVDGTLLNFGFAYAQAQRAVAGKLGVDYTPAYRALDEQLSWKVWREVGLDNTTDEDVQANYHTYYYDSLQRHFTYLLRFLGLKGNVSDLVEHYLTAVASSCDFMEEGAFAIYKQLSKSHTLALATNGVSRVQRPRTETLLPYTSAIFISEEMGCIKPSQAFFEKLLDGLGCRPEDCLMVGDSLSNDIAGAKSAGLHTCWYNPKGKKDTGGVGPLYTISRLEKLISICG